VKHFYLALVPWAAFDMVVRSAGLGLAWGAGVALGYAALVSLLSRRARLGPVLFVAVATFAVVLLVTLLFHPDAQLRLYARAVTSGSLGVVLGVSVLVRPCTSHYVEDVVAPRYWSRLAFRDFNRRLTLIWSATCLAIGGLDAAGARSGSPVATTFYIWLVPVGLVLAAGVFSARAVATHFDPDEATLHDALRELDTLDEPQHDRLGVTRLRAYRGGANAP